MPSTGYWNVGMANMGVSGESSFSLLALFSYRELAIFSLEKSIKLLSDMSFSGVHI